MTASRNAAALMLAAESLLAQHNDDSFVLPKHMEMTSAQQTLGIPQYLVYIAGLVRCITPENKREQQELFHKFQNQYQRNESSKLFQLSPTMIPSESCQREIEAHLTEKVQELEKNSKRAVDELLTKEKAKANAVPAKSTSSSNRKLVKASHQKSTAEIKVMAEESSSEEILSSMTVREILATVRVENTETDVESEWIEVKKREKSGLHKETNSHDETSCSGSAPNRDDAVPVATTERLKKTIIADADKVKTTDSVYISEASTAGSQGQNSEGAVEESEDTSAPLDAGKTDTSETELVPLTKSVATSSSSTSQSRCHLDDCQEGPDETLDSLTKLKQSSSALEQDNIELKQQICKLQQQLTEKDDELTKKQQLHAKLLRQEQESSQEQIQSLQLRLYIAESRLKTFEDALSQHVETVAQNTASSKSTRPVDESHNNASPLFARIKKKS